MPDSPTLPPTSISEGDSILRLFMPTTVLGAAVTWSDDTGLPCHLIGTPHCSLELVTHCNPSSQTLLFKLRTVVEVRSRATSTIPIYVLLDPAHIESLAIAENVDYSADAQEVFKSLGNTNNVAGLSFRLTQPGNLVVPRHAFSAVDFAHLEKICRMAKQTKLTIHIRCENKSTPDWLAYLAKGIQDHKWKVDSRAAGLRALYAGKGGKVVVDHGELLAAPPRARRDRDPPSYEHLEPSAPPPPLLEVEKSADGSSASKRRRMSPVQYQEHDQACKSEITDMIENVCQKLLSEHRAHSEAMLSEAHNEYMRLLAEQQQRFQDELRQVENRILERVDLRLADAVGKLQDELNAEVTRLDDSIGEFDSHVDERVSLEVDDQMTSIKAEIEDFVRDEMADVAESIKSQVQEARYLSQEEPQI